MRLPLLHYHHFFNASMIPSPQIFYNHEPPDTDPLLLFELGLHSDAENLQSRILLNVPLLRHS